MAHRAIVVWWLAGLPFVTGCSLVSYPTPVTVTVSLPRTSEMTAVRTARSGPEISAMKCIGLIVKGAVGAVTSGQVGGRSVSCLALEGAFYGPYSPTEIASGVALTLPTATYEFSAVGFDGLANCGTGPSTIFGSGTLQTYRIVSPVSVDLASATSLSLNGAAYVAASAEDRTPLCPPISTDCAGAQACDRFVGDNQPLVNHPMDVGVGWGVSQNDQSHLFENSFNPQLGESSGYPRSYFATMSTGRDANVQLRLQLAQTSLTSHQGIILRSTTFENYAAGVIERDDNLGTCKTRIVERISGVENYVASKNYSFPSDCDSVTLQDLSFSANGLIYRLVYRGQTLTFVSASPALLGTYTGFTAGHLGFFTAAAAIRFFRTDQL